MDIMDKNKENIPDGDYLEFCNLLKNVYDNQSPVVHRIPPRRSLEDQMELDIKLIMEQSNSTRIVSIMAFKMHNNDIVDAILELSMWRLSPRDGHLTQVHMINARVQQGRTREFVIKCISDNTIEMYVHSAYRALIHCERNNIIIQRRREPRPNEERQHEIHQERCRGIQDFIDISDELKNND